MFSLQIFKIIFLIPTLNFLLIDLTEGVVRLRLMFFESLYICNSSGLQFSSRRKYMFPPAQHSFHTKSYLYA